MRYRFYHHGDFVGTVESTSFEEALYKFQYSLLDHRLQERVLLGKAQMLVTSEIFCRQNNLVILGRDDCKFPMEAT